MSVLSMNAPPAFEFIARHIPYDDAPIMYQELAHMVRRRGADEASVVLRNIFALGQPVVEEVLRHPSLELYLNAMMPSQLNSPAFRNMQYRALVPNTATVSSFRSQREPSPVTIHAALPESFNVQDRPAEQAVKCKRCKKKAYKSRRGLREHMMLKHGIAGDQARNEAEEIFTNSQERIEPPQYIMSPETAMPPMQMDYLAANIGPSSSDLHGFGDQFSQFPPSLAPISETPIARMPRFMRRQDMATTVSFPHVTTHAFVHHGTAVADEGSFFESMGSPDYSRGIRLQSPFPTQQNHLFGQQQQRLRQSPFSECGFVMPFSPVMEALSQRSRASSSPERGRR